tara:strand:+ start:958 stop:1173 length:216 start_codon:yes stop_codon:yes gene_type:complete
MGVYDTMVTTQTELFHTYERDERAAKVYRNSNGFYVELWELGKLIEKREVYDHAEIYAENVAENWVDGLIA